MAMQIKPRHVGRALSLLLIAFIILNCSGLTFPLLTPRRTLSSSLARDLNITLPASAVVERSARVAFLDPSIFYFVTLTPAEADAFCDALAARGDVALDRPIHFDLPSSGGPKWWTPSALPAIQRYDASPQDHRTAFTAFHVPGSKTVYLFWCEF